MKKLATQGSKRPAVLAGPQEAPLLPPLFALETQALLFAKGHLFLISVTCGASYLPLALPPQHFYLEQLTQHYWLSTAPLGTPPRSSKQLPEALRFFVVLLSFCSMLQVVELFDLGLFVEAISKAFRRWALPARPPAASATSTSATAGLGVAALFGHRFR